MAALLALARGGSLPLAGDPRRGLDGRPRRLGRLVLRGRVGIYAASESSRLEVDGEAHPIEALVGGRVASTSLALGRDVQASERARRRAGAADGLPPVRGALPPFAVSEPGAGSASARAAVEPPGGSNRGPRLSTPPRGRADAPRRCSRRGAPLSAARSCRAAPPAAPPPRPRAGGPRRSPRGAAGPRPTGRIRPSRRK
jgi:hypothetical protein